MPDENSDSDSSLLLDLITSLLPSSVEDVTYLVDMEGEGLCLHHFQSEAGVSGNSLLPYKFLRNSQEFIRKKGIPAHPWNFFTKPWPWEK